MATPKPGEIRCPTCHRSTPPASFCTQCGSAIPSDARIRPRGMDRDELQDRIRARRSGGEPFRRGVDDERGGYERFEPDPIDTRARRARIGPQARHDFLTEGQVEEVETPGAASSSGDLTRDRDEWARPAAAYAPTAVPPPAEPYAPPPSDVPVAEPEPEPDRWSPPAPEPVWTAQPASEEPAYEDNFDDGAAYDESEYPYPYEDWEDRSERRTGTGALAILGFLGLGVLALLGGALLAGIFDGGPAGIADATPSPTATVQATPEPTPSATPEDTGSPAASASPGASGEPIVFPDGFTAEAQPCIRGSVTSTGCNSNGASNSGAVDIWVGFTKGDGDDVIGATLIAPDGSTVDGSIDLADIDCESNCTGYTYFPFDASEPGTYEVRVTRNGELAAVTTFEVT